ncbi:MAG TPA: VCBS repeat-containing protein, partial [Candidatus Angelobacter sp.]|nr:VCBS repeat-containing protein [Candidatus Angelobacter sp.]
MTALLRSLLRLGVSALVILAATFIYAQESMMLRNNNAPAVGVAINQGDFNRDGILDLVTANINGTVSVFPGRADGTFAPPITTTTGHQPNDLAFGDFNNDGKLDVAVSNIDSNTVQILLGNGDGTFTLGDTILLDQVPASITTSDFNNDGKLDLAVGIGVITNQGVTTNEIEMLQGDGAGHFARVNTLHFGTSPLITKVRVGDFNADGKVDIAVVLGGWIDVLTNVGNFNFGADIISGAYSQINDMNTGDLNQDGFTDILVSWSDAVGSRNGGVDVYYGTSSEGSFIFKRPIPAGGSLYESPGQIIAADVNGDGINDIVGLDNDSTFADGVYVWLCNGDGSCDPTPTKFIYTTNGAKQAMVAGDFNRDGKI